MYTMVVALIWYRKRRVMVSCTRCWLHTAMRIVNLVTTLLGIGLIGYSLWLLKRWDLGLSQIPLDYPPPIPWFMYTCLCTGIGVCSVAICGQMIPNSVGNSTLSIYIVSVSSLQLLQVAVIVVIFYRMNWSEKIAGFIDEDHQEFKSFLTLQLTISRLILFTILVPQINVLMIAIGLRGMGTEPSHSHIEERRRFTQSFLVGSISDLPNLTNQTCSKCESFYVINPCGFFMSYSRRFFRMPFGRRIDLS